jgi:hypothetical protein
MIDGALADPAGVKRWKGDASGLCKMIRLEQVVDRIIRGIEHRADMIVCPAAIRSSPARRGPFRWAVERLGVRRANVDAANVLADDGRG